MGASRTRFFLIETRADGSVRVVHRSYLSAAELAQGRTHPALKTLGREWVTRDELSARLSQRFTPAAGQAESLPTITRRDAGLAPEGGRPCPPGATRRDAGAPVLAG